VARAKAPRGPATNPPDAQAGPLAAMRQSAIQYGFVALGGEMILEVNGWTVTVRPSHSRFGLSALTVRQGSPA
jgi:hypothetical protein